MLALLIESCLHLLERLLFEVSRLSQDGVLLFQPSDARISILFGLLQDSLVLSELTLDGLLELFKTALKLVELFFLPLYFFDLDASGHFLLQRCDLFSQQTLLLLPG